MVTWFVVLGILIYFSLCWVLGFISANKLLPYFHELVSKTRYSYSPIPTSSYHRNAVRIYFLWTLVLYPFSAWFILFIRKVNSNIDATNPALLEKRKRELERDIREKERILEIETQKLIDRDITNRDLDLGLSHVVAQEKIERLFKRVKSRRYKG